MKRVGASNEARLLLLLLLLMLLWRHLALNAFCDTKNGQINRADGRWQIFGNQVETVNQDYI